VVVAVVAALQWREWRRKRPAAATAPAHAAGNGHAGPAEAPQGERGASAP
jgi:hypothetical protein